MTKEQFAIGTIIVVAVLIVLAWRAWSKRKRTQADIPAPLAVPADFVGGERHPVLYVATTVAGNRYDRIAVHDLGFRARATLECGASGVVLALPGRGIFIPADRIDGVERTTWTIDRVVEPGGMLSIGWRPGAGEADTIETAVRVIGDDRAIFAALQRYTAHQEGAAS